MKAPDVDTVEITKPLLDSLLVTAALSTFAEVLTFALAGRYYDCGPGADWLRETQDDLEQYLRDIFTGFEVPTIGERLAADFANTLEGT